MITHPSHWRTCFIHLASSTHSAAASGGQERPDVLEGESYEKQREAENLGDSATKPETCKSIRASPRVAIDLSVKLGRREPLRPLSNWIIPRI